MMSERFYLVGMVIGGGCLLAVVVAAMLALYLGRGLRAHGTARFGGHGLRVYVEVPAGPTRRRASSSEEGSHLVGAPMVPRGGGSPRKRMA